MALTSQSQRTTLTKVGATKNEPGRHIVRHFGLIWRSAETFLLLSSLSKSGMIMYEN